MNIRTYRKITPQLGQRVFVDPTAVIIGDVIIGDDCSIWPQVAIRGDMHKIRIGNKTNIQDGCILHITHAGPYNPNGFPLSIGSEVTVGHKALLHGCTIEDRVLVGMDATIMDGVLIQSNIVIAAGSLVPPGKKLESGYLYMGRPAKKSRELTKKEFDYFSYTALNYVKLKDTYLAEKV